MIASSVGKMDKDVESPIFTSLGMFIIDEIHYLDKPSVFNIIGGGGFFGLFGARVALSFNNTRKAGFILDAGSDFPAEIKDIILSWQTSTIIRDNPERLTTRGWNSYGEHDFREFKYLTPKKRIDIPDIIGYDFLLQSRSFHFICSADRCADMIQQLEKVQGIAYDNPNSAVICWEPVPYSCIPENLSRCQKILSKVDILSPNSEEAARFFGEPEPFTKPELESLADRYIPYLTKEGNQGLGSVLVLRCGELGIYVCSKKGYKKWFPAYQILNPSPKVLDCTGAGNTACGAFATALLLGHDWETAGVMASVASGLCLEQLGVAKLSGKSDWNGSDLRDRIDMYLQWSKLETTTDKVLEDLEK
ncbi:Mak32 protein [Saccharomycopsis crataegensis]|uniref:Mak32 protein n=1 Tax=Saccharomycopsis crataegensis TaxID=43959 RepID=A0AAV5QIQ4_9ASCO|nr:Mak32 protein [Saccharomycopsis crataegensis]